jgi:hypothetical protein
MELQSSLHETVLEPALSKCVHWMGNRTPVESPHTPKQPEVAAAVGGMLDLFTKYGWAEAASLTFILDEAFR